MRHFQIFLLILLLTLLSVVFSFGQTKLYFAVKGNFVMAAGTESDYEEGVNDFPLSSAYTTPGFSGGITYSKGAVFFGLETHLNLSGKVTLTDSSDSDTVKIDTYKSLSAFLILGYDLINTSSLRFFLKAGGGLNYALDAESRIYTSAQSFETEIDPPEKDFPLSFLGGAGFELKLSPGLGLLLGGHYQYTAFDQPRSQITLMGGLIFTF